MTELDANHGVVWSELLRAEPRDEAAAASRGVVRRADKLLLPASCEASLEAQDAARRAGGAFFEVTASDGRRTHACVLSFTAPHGCVSVPPHVAACLGDAVWQGPVHVRFAALPKATFARLQPLQKTFQKDVPDIKAALEALLACHCCLSLGDVLKVGNHSLRVAELRPQDGCSVVDTDLEVVVDISAEAEAEEAEKLRLVAEATRRAAAEALLREQHAAQAAAEAASAQAAAAAAAATAERRRAAASASLQAHPEPPASDVHVVRVALRLPSGGRAVRRFAFTDPIEAFFLWADSLWTHDGAPFVLAATLPRRVLRRGPGLIQDADLGAEAVLNIEHTQ